METLLVFKNCLEFTVNWQFKETYDFDQLASID